MTESDLHVTGPGDARSRESEEPLDRRDGAFEQLEQELSSVHQELRAHQAQYDAQKLELRVAHEQLVVAQRRYRSLFNLAPIGHLSLDGEGRILELNLAAANLFQRSVAHLRRRRIAHLVVGTDRERLENHLAVVMNGREHGVQLELVRGDGTTIAVQLRSTGLAEISGTPTRCHCALVDVSAHRETEEQLRKARDYLEHLAHHDPLTDLPNRLLFADRLRHAVHRARRHGRRLALLFLDVDRFKLVNDSLGHSAGDSLLQTVARRIVDCVRDEDTVARLGGDEFTVILENIGSEQDVERIARKLVARISEPVLLDEQEVCLSASIGVSMYPTDATVVDDLVKYADAAMYHAKDRGRSDVQFFTTELSATLRNRLSLEHELRRAIAGNELMLYFQPQHRTQDRRLAGLEALVRWNHPTRGIVLPSEFIPVAEESGLIDGLGQWVLDTACRQMRDWLTRGLRVRRVAVNISARQFARPGFHSTIAESLSAARIPANLLEIELTESALLTDPESAIEVLSELRAAGVHVAIDDFGTGFSSLSRLRRLPISRLKIDASFVQGITLNADDRSIASAIISMAHDLNLEAVSEGVETAQQHAFLERSRCDVLQGYYIGYPEEATKIEPLLRAA